MLIDMQSFYASVEKAKVPEYRNQPLLVAGDPAKRSGVVLAACPIAKACGVESGAVLWQALQKCPQAIVVKPHMQEYISVSSQITQIVESFTDLVECYSIDEMFADCTSSMHLFADNPIDLAKQIQEKIYNETGIYARVGISENKILSKLCCDMIAKKIEGGIHYLNKDDLSDFIWKQPIRKMWGIGAKMEKHLNRMGITTIGELAKSPLPRLRKKWGVNGEVIWRVANGLDDSQVTVNTHNHQKEIGNGMTLPRDYTQAWEIEAVLLDLCTEVSRRARQKGLIGSVVSVGISGADFEVRTGFHRQRKLPDPTNLTQEVYDAAKTLFYENWDGLPVRRVGVSISDLSDSNTYQLTFFGNKDHLRAIDEVMDHIKDRFGEVAILRASSITSAGLAVERAAKIGGHAK